MQNSAPKPPKYFHGLSNGKKKLDADLQQAIPYALHDLRRTFASKPAGLGTPIHITGKLHKHVLGTVNGVAALRNRYF